jgi:hypothetical protein
MYLESILCKMNYFLGADFSVKNAVVVDTFVFR